MGVHDVFLLLLHQASEMHQFPTLDEVTRHAAQHNQHKSSLTQEPCPSLTPALLQLILQTLQALGDRKIARERVEDGQQECSVLLPDIWSRFLICSLQLERYLTPFIPLDIS